MLSCRRYVQQPFSTGVDDHFRRFATVSTPFYIGKVIGRRQESVNSDRSCRAKNSKHRPIGHCHLPSYVVSVFPPKSVGASYQIRTFTLLWCYSLLKLTFRKISILAEFKIITSISSYSLFRRDTIYHTALYYI